MRTEANSKPSQQKSSAEVQHDVIVLLKQDHAMVKKMFAQYEKLAHQGDSEAKVRLANQICAALIAHTLVEEEIFYPAAREATENEDMLNEAKVEHDSAKDLIAQIQAMSPEDEMYDAKVKVLSEYIEHHVEEEEKEMFPQVRATKKIDLRAMASELNARKEVVMETLHGSDGDIDPQQLRGMLGMDAAH